MKKIHAKYSSAAEIEVKFDAGREIEDFAISVTVLSKKDFLPSTFDKETAFIKEFRDLCQKYNVTITKQCAYYPGDPSDYQFKLGESPFLIDVDELAGEFYKGIK